jgi:hypothetical protein
MKIDGNYENKHIHVFFNVTHINSENLEIYLIF